MKQKVESDTLLTRYLLGELAEDDMLRIEEAYLADDDLYEQLQAVERDLIDKYLQGELSRSDRERFERHFLSSPRRQEKLRFAKVFNAYVSRQKPADESENLRSKSWIKAWPKLAFNPAISAALSLIIIAALGFGIWRTFLYESELSKGTSALKKAYQERRPLQARISDLGYAPFSETRGDENKPTNDKQLALAERILLSEVLDDPNAASHHALGRFYLAKSDFEKAIQEFREAIKTDQKNAELHSDLGAAYLERAAAERDERKLSDLSASLEHLNRAIELDDSLLAAYFNKALSLQRMNEMASAREAWEDYLKRDANSEWSKEAERNLQLLKGQRLPG